MTETKTLHIKLKPINSDLAKFHCYTDNPNDFTPRNLKLSEIENLIKAAETDYYTMLPQDFSKTGQQLYHWLDGPDRFLDQAIQKCLPTKEIVLAIETQGRLSHLPWEVMHDGNGFFVEQKYPLIVPVRWQDKKRATYEPENRPLQVLFMATSPTDVQPVLEFEQEEGLILNATSRFPLNLTVEESGNRDELEYLINSYESGWFDILHLSGHAQLTNDGGRFLTESETGNMLPASAQRIAEALTHMPKVVFLSGCHTGEVGKEGAVPSLCEELLELGAQSVLGWGRPVLDIEASRAAADLYGELSKGHSIIPALARTRQGLMKQGARDWHLLRLYTAGDAPKALVTPLKTPGRKKALPASLIKTRFLDEHNQVKVPTREAFVGRRRVIQRCLKALQDEDKTGVIIHGMGGLGKSSLAARLCDRLKDNYNVIVYVGNIDEPVLVNRIGEDLEDILRENLLCSQPKLKYRIRNTFGLTEKPFLIVLDDFEQNFEHTGYEPVLRDGCPVISVEAKGILDALCFAIQKTMEEGHRHRVIITSRYLWESEEIRWFYSEPLDRFPQPDVKKKVNRLETVQRISENRQEKLKPYAIKVADGNPRLLEWLFEILAQPDLNHEVILEQMGQKETQFRENILAEELLKQHKKELCQLLALMTVYNIAVPAKAVQAVCSDISDMETHKDRAAALGLLEVTLSDKKLFRVSRILTPLLEEYQPENKHEVFQTACTVLHEIWWQQTDNPTEEYVFEIHRLALMANNPDTTLELGNWLAAVMDQQCRYRDGVQLCRKTIEIAEAGLDPNHPDLSTGLSWLGSLLKSMGELQAATPYHEKVMAIRKKVLGEEHPDFAAGLNNLAILKYYQKQYKESLGLITSAHEIFQKTLGPNHPNTKDSLQAIEIIEEALKK
jgi:tetratricopeptide (TPR) repeat protein/CHAT domain-containing protein